MHQAFLPRNQNSESLMKRSTSPAHCPQIQEEMQEDGLGRTGHNAFDPQIQEEMQIDVVRTYQLY